ncbi:hypothetical protein O6H91_Y544000 [Diphasiastrum complanatum]|nr:hypothetical protein O6H91_Y544000 [Diphasiastrum complanatum]
MQMDALAFKKMDFQEFCAAAMNVHQLEGLDGWENQARVSYGIFDKESNRLIVVDELARELGLGQAVPAHAVLHEWIRHSDGKLSFIGFSKLLHGVVTRPSRQP